MATTAKIAFGLYDTTAKGDSSPACGDVQPFVSLSDLLEEDLQPPLYGTLEEDLFLLDGSYAPFPDAPQSQPWGLWSGSMSGEDGSFENPVTLTISFTENHSSMGLTLRFGGDTWPSQIDVEWKSGQGNTILQRRYFPNAMTFYLDGKVENYRQIVLRFAGTAKPYRYLKLTEIKYGLKKIFSGEDLASARILEEAHPLSAELGINTLDFTLHSDSREFSLLNPSGMFSALQERQRLDVWEEVNDTEQYLGAFWLDNWESGTDNAVTLSATSLLGVMDKTDFMGGIYSNVPAGQLIGEIMTSAGVAYELDSSLAAILLSGYLPICTHREALQQVAFALGVVVSCARSDKVRIYPPPMQPSSFITPNRKFDGQTIKLLPVVTSVAVTAHSYLAGDNQRELLKEILASGEYEIVFDAPMHSLSVTGASITASNVNYARLLVAAEGEVLLTGKEYEDQKQIITKRLPSLPANTPANQLRIQDATLVSMGNAGAVGEWLLSYRRLRHENSFNILAGAETAGDMVMIRTKGEYIRGYVQSMELDLTGGFIAKAQVTGLRIETLASAYAGEIYAGERQGVM